MAAQRGKQVESDESYKRRVRLYARAVPGMHRAGPGERGGASYGRRAVATAEWAAMQISVDGKGLISRATAAMDSSACASVSYTVNLRGATDPIGALWALARGHSSTRAVSASDLEQQNLLAVNPSTRR